MNCNLYLILSVKTESINRSRFLFDFVQYQAYLSTNKFSNKLQLWTHYHKYNNNNPDLYYLFHHPTQSVEQYIGYLSRQKLSINAKDFDYNYYLQHNPDVAVQCKNKNLASVWNHYLNYGMFEMRLISFDKSINIKQFSDCFSVTNINKIIINRQHGNAFQKNKYFKSTCSSPELESNNIPPESNHTSYTSTGKESCHTLAESSHTSTESNYTDKESCHTLAESNHTQAESNHTHQDSCNIISETTIDQLFETYNDKINELIIAQFNKINSDAQDIDEQQNYLMMLSQVEQILDSKLNCILKNKFRLYDGICYIKIPEFNIKSVSVKYHRTINKINIIGIYDLDFVTINSILGTFVINFISGEYMNPIFETVTGTFKLFDTDNRIYIGAIYGLDSNFNYRFDTSLLNFSGAIKLFIDIQYLISLI